MLEITITPTMIVFTSLPDDLYSTISQQFDLEECKKGHCIKGTPAELYKHLLKLTYTYDLEVS